MSKLQLYINDKEAVLSTDTAFAINIKSFNPITQEDTTTSYTTSIKLPRCKQNDLIFFAYANPALKKKEKLSAKVFIGGIFLDQFFVEVTVQKDSYQINLLKQIKSLSKVLGEFVPKNNIDSWYYYGSAMATSLFRASDFDKLGDVRLSDIVVINKLTTVDVADLRKKKFTLKNQNQAYNIRTGYMECVGNRLIIADDTIRTLYEDPDMRRRTYIRMNVDDQTAKNLTLVALTPTAASPTSVTLRFFDGDTGIIFNRLTGGAVPDSTGRYRSTYSCAINTNHIVYADPNVNFDIRVDSGSTVYDWIVEPDSTFVLFDVLEDFAITTKVDVGIKSKYEMMKGAAMLFGSRIDVDNGRIVMRDILKDEKAEFFGKDVSIESISAADFEAQKLELKSGDYSKSIDWATHSNEEVYTIDFKLPYKPGEYVTIGWRAPLVPVAAEGRSEFYQIFGETETMSKLIALYNQFSDCVEVNISCELSIFDIIGFDQSKKYYLKELQSFFYVSEISGWDYRSGKAKVKLLKIK